MTTQEIKNQLESFETAECGLFHETVLIDKSTGKPIKNIIGDEAHYERVQLCPANIRNKRLGCAHSKANHNFFNLIAVLKTEDENIIQGNKNIEALFQKIYMLDHEKGDLEKDLVETDDKESVQTKIETCISNHSEIIQTLKQEKNQLIKLI